MGRNVTVQKNNNTRQGGYILAMSIRKKPSPGCENELVRSNGHYSQHFKGVFATAEEAEHPRRQRMFRHWCTSLMDRRFVDGQVAQPPPLASPTPTPFNSPAKIGRCPSKRARIMPSIPEDQQVKEEPSEEARKGQEWRAEHITCLTRACCVAGGIFVLLTCEPDDYDEAQVQRAMVRCHILRDYMVRIDTRAMADKLHDLATEAGKFYQPAMTFSGRTVREWWSTTLRLAVSLRTPVERGNVTSLSLRMTSRWSSTRGSLSR